MIFSKNHFKNILRLEIFHLTYVLNETYIHSFKLRPNLPCKKAINFSYHVTSNMNLEINICI